jgi:hypothetical protein
MNSSSIGQEQAAQYLHGLSELIQGQLAAACADLEQTGELLDEAVDQLNLSFNALGEGLMQAQSGLTEASPLVPHVHSAITGLQFHDLTSQLLQRILRRLEGLGEIVAAATTTDGRIPEWDRALQALAAQQAALEQRLQGGLRQQNLSGGDIELF